MSPVTRFVVELIIWIALWQLASLLMDKQDRKVQLIVYAVIFVGGMTWLYAEQSKRTLSTTQ